MFIELVVLVVYQYEDVYRILAVNIFGCIDRNYLVKKSID